MTFDDCVKQLSEKKLDAVLQETERKSLQEPPAAGKACHGALEVRLRTCPMRRVHRAGRRTPTPASPKSARSSGLCTEPAQRCKSSTFATHFNTHFRAARRAGEGPRAGDGGGDRARRPDEDMGYREADRERRSRDATPAGPGREG